MASTVDIAVRQYRLRPIHAARQNLRMSDHAESVRTGGRHEELAPLRHPDQLAVCRDQSALAHPLPAPAFTAGLKLKALEHSVIVPIKVSTDQNTRVEVV